MMLVSRSVLFPAMMLLGLLGSVQATVVKTQASQVMKGLASKTALGIQDHFKSSQATSGHSRHLLAVSNDFSKQAGRSLLQMAPDKSCCVASYGDSTTDNCKHCEELPNFVCRPSHQQFGVSDTSTDCISFAYADEATCLAADGAQVWLTSSDNNGFGCPATTTSDGYVCTLFTAVGTCGSIFSKPACSSQTLCKWNEDDSSCDINNGENSYIASMLATYISSIINITESCMSSSICSAAASCTMHDACVVNFEGIQEASPGTAATNYLFAEYFKCRIGFTSQITCNSDAAPKCEWQQDSDDGTWKCEPSSHVTSLLLFESARECDFDEPTAADMTASKHDLCPAYEADLKCMGITTQLTCSVDPDCKWDKQEEDPWSTLYPCMKADNLAEQSMKLYFSDMSSYVKAAYECAVHSSKTQCVEDFECRWSYETGSGTLDESCASNNNKLSKYYGEHPHVAAAAEIFKVCHGNSQNDCGTGADAGKCQWVEASSGGDAECIFSREYAISVFSCTCPQLSELLKEEGISAEQCSTADVSLKVFVSLAAMCILFMLLLT
jgi:hypothetical protein